MRTVLKIFFLLLLLASNELIADVIHFDNGDRLSGDIVILVENKLTLENTIIGKIEIDVNKVKTFSTANPIDIYYRDGNKDKTIIEESDQGMVIVYVEELNQTKNVEIPDILRLGPLDDAVTWRGNIRSGLNGSNGDSDDLNFNAGLNLQRRSLRDRTTFNGVYIFERSDGNTDENKWFTDLKYDYFFNNDFYGFAFSRIEQDDASDLNLRTILSSGVGYQWLERDDFKFSTEVGLSWLYEDFTTDSDDNKISARLAYFYENEFWDRLKFFNNLEYYPKLSDPSDFLIITTVGFRSNVTEKLFTEAKVIFEHDATPADDSDKNNVTYLFSLGMLL